MTILSRIGICIALSGSAHSVYSVTTEELFNLSLQDLMSIKISTGSLSSMLAKDSPSALTVIRRDQIELSSAKNIPELLEVYVPGMMLMTHSEGDKIGLRGHIAAENYKLLLLVNGKNITNMVYEGAIVEIDQWNLSDIEKIEVVRGPGSVTYGTGAIAGVINIITKSVDQKGHQLDLVYNATYRSQGLSYQFNKAFGNFDSYLFASYRTTEGLENPKYYRMNGAETNNGNYLGFFSDDEYGSQPFLGDSFDRPQVKLHWALEHSDGFKMFTRYTQSGQTHHFRTLRPKLDENDNVTGVTDSRALSLRSFIIAPEYRYQLNDHADLNLSLTYDTQEYIRYDFANPTWPEEHYNNIKDYAFSQNRWKASLLYAFENDKWNITTGYEFEQINAGAPWGKGQEHLMIREGVYLINDAETSVYTRNPELRNRPPEDRIEEIGDGLDFYTHTHLVEGTYQLSNKHKILYAHRLDFPDASSTMFSPRLAYIMPLSEDHSMVVTAQRALRMMPLRAQYLLDKNNGDRDRDHEKIDNIEISYTNSAIDNAVFNARAFYSDIDVVGFTGVDLQFLGNMKLAGLELESHFKKGRTEVILNHAYLKPINIRMNEALKTGGNRNNISFADYYYETRSDVPLVLDGYGDGINNWSDNVTKLVLTQKFLNDALSLHLNTQIYWDYNGAYDEMRMYQHAYDSFDTSALTNDELSRFEEQQSIFDRERDLIEKEEAYKKQINLGVSLSYRWRFNTDTDARLTLFGQNLLQDRRRYYVSTGSSRFYPERLSFLKEPTVWGIRFSLDY